MGTSVIAVKEATRPLIAVSPPRFRTSLIRKLPSMLCAMKMMMVPKSMRQNILFSRIKTGREEDCSRISVSAGGMAVSASRRSRSMSRLPANWSRTTAKPAKGRDRWPQRAVMMPRRVLRMTNEKLPMERAKPKLRGALARSSRTHRSRFMALTGIMAVMYST